MAESSEPRAFPRVAIILVVAAALVITMAGVRSTAGIIGPSFLALVLTITVHPARRWLEDRNVPHWFASTAVVLAVYLILVLVVLMLVISIGRLAALLPQYSQQINDQLTSVGSWLAKNGVGQDQVNALISKFDVSSVVGVATDVLSRVLGLLSNLFFIATLLIFIAFDTRGMTRALDGVASTRPELVEAMHGFARATRSYMAVSTVFGLICAVIDTAALSIMNVPGAFVWGVLAFATNYIPNIGFVIGLVPPALIGFLQGGPSLMVGVIIAYIVVNFVIQSVIQPRFIGDAVGLSTTITFLSLLFWAWVIGALGALLAVPLSLFVKAVLIDADPKAHWAVPFITGRAPARPRAEVALPGAHPEAAADPSD